MSYESYLDSELKLAGIELESGERERLSNIFKIIDDQGHSGGSIGILLPALRAELGADMSQTEATSTTTVFNADTFGEGLSKPVFQALNGLTLERAYVVADIALKAVGFTPFTPLTGESDEWYEPHAGTLQNKRMGSVFKDPKLGIATWLDANRLHYPSRWNNNATWSAHSKRGVLRFPFDPAVGTANYYYTSESLRHHVVVDPNPNRAFLTQAMLTTASGAGGTDVLLSPRLETVGAEVGNSLISAFTEFWAAVVASEELAEANAFPYNAHHVALKGLLYASDYDTSEGKPDNVTVFGLNLPYEAIPHLARMVSFLPDSIYVKADQLVHPYDANLNGHFVAVPVFTVTPDSMGWEQLPDLVTVVWNDSLVTNSKVYIVTAECGVEVVSGDHDDWLWTFREKNNIPHAQRSTDHVLENDKLTDAASPIDPTA